jgi:malonyl-CoA/methylmalonyl-CoA synthetase
MDETAAPATWSLRPWSEHLPPGSDAEGVELVTATSLAASWRSHWLAEPGRPALVDRAGTTITGAELDERTALVAARLAAAGAGEGERVVVSGVPSVDLALAHVAALRAGATVVPLNPDYTETEVAAVVGDARPVVALTDRSHVADWIVASSPATRVTGLDFARLPANGDAAALDAAARDDVALLVYTSGTTGRPKGVPLSHANLLASVEAVRLAWRWSPDDRLVLALPLFHVHGLVVGLFGTLHTGASAVVHERFDPGAVLEAVRQGGSMFFGVPTMWHRLVAEPGAPELGRLRLAVSGSAPLAPELHRAVAEVAGRPPLERYGMTETIMLVSNPYDGERRAGSVGFPLPGVEVRLRPVGQGGAAAIDVRGPNVFGGYWHRPDATAEAFADGWLVTGDLGEVDPDGYLRIAGRAKELIITGGFNVYPREVEDVLRGHPAVADAAVVGLPDAEWGERVCAVVITADEVTDDELAAWCADRLVSYKRPRRWERADQLPRNAMGKVLRHEVVAQLT